MFAADLGDSQALHVDRDRTEVGRQALFLVALDGKGRKTGNGLILEEGNKVQLQMSEFGFDVFATS